MKQEMDGLLQIARDSDQEVEFLRKFYSVMESAVKLNIDQSTKSIADHALWALQEVKK
ncbi:hypothetical protein [Lentibacillus sp. Marseille-P4043]|uniref:hypothetical protein n=1 Tax=Lentibacillus sp. Marseille-P4043 TaxID=2040293 RepID=UPI00131A603B|nr:hypothetical protein [Lentibacillus sp. Marseille-P4043]